MGGADSDGSYCRRWCRQLRGDCTCCDKCRGPKCLHPTRHRTTSVFWAAVANTDKTEGRGPEEVLGYFEQEADAKQAVKGQGVMGGDGAARRVIVYASFEAYADVKLSLARKRALEKLTLEERLALGLETK